jgi:Restriction endonuclease
LLQSFRWGRLVEMLRLWPIVVITACVTWYFASDASLFRVALLNLTALSGGQWILIASALAFVIAVGLAALAWVVERRRRDLLWRTQTQRGLHACVTRATKEHMETLQSVRRTLLDGDFGGPLHRPRWIQFLDEFVGARVAPALTADELAEFRADRDGIVHMVDRLVEAEADTQSATSSFSPSMQADAFEAYCAETLQSAGWNARVNVSDRVGGVDIIGAKGGRRITLHCIVDGRQVSAATLEAAEAGRAVEEADFAVVVTGVKLASPVELPTAAMKVFLVQHRYLAQLEAILDRGQSAGLAPTAVPDPSTAPAVASGEQEAAERRPVEGGSAGAAASSGAAVRGARALTSAMRRIFRRRAKAPIYVSTERAPWRDSESPDFTAPIDDFPELSSGPKDAPPPIPNRPSQS